MTNWSCFFIHVSSVYFLPTDLLLILQDKIVHLNMQTIIARLEKIIADYSPQLTNPGEEYLADKPSPVKWSGKECLGHLIDSAQNNIRRFVVAQYEDMPFIVYE